jgi:riboflavin kinase/FMN adenylyltransferase
MEEIEPDIREGTAVTIGNFDGVHLAHQQILSILAQQALREKIKSLVITFDPHPFKVLKKEKKIELIQSVEERISMIGEHGIDCCLILEFTMDFSAIEAAEFISEFLCKMLHMKHIAVGDDTMFGHKREGNVLMLCANSQDLGFHVEIMDPVFVRGTRVSSSNIRNLIKTGNLEHANALLGRSFHIQGKVIKGRGMGKILGFPTANLEVFSELIPGDGVYASRVIYNDKAYNAVVHIGPVPTFSVENSSVEVHMLDFPESSLTGKNLVVDFHSKIRDVMKFADKNDLIEQIKKDIQTAKQKDF